MTKCNQCGNEEADHYYMKDGKEYSKYRHVFMPDNSPKKCICCLENDVSEGGQQSHCDNCWNYLMPERDHKGEKLEWGDIWAILCHWHTLHDEKDKDYEFAHQIIIGCYTYEGRGQHGEPKCLVMEPSDNCLCDGRKGHSGPHFYEWE